MPKETREYVGLGIAFLALILQFTPEQFVEGFQQWRWLIGAVAALGLGYFLYQFGYRRGAESQPKETPAADGPYLSPDRLKYYVRQLRDLLLEHGDARREAIGRALAALERVHPLWHDEATYNARKEFLGVAAEAAEVRRKNGNRRYGIWGDFRENERASFEARLTETSEALIATIH